MRIWGVWLMLSVSGAAAVYHVSPSGSDILHSGTAVSPWRSIQKGVDMARAGDTVVVQAGEYGEMVRTRNAGRAEARIVLRAEPANDPLRPVVVRAFRVSHPYHTFEGFTLTGAQDATGSHVRIEANGEYTTFTNNTVRDGVYLVADDLRFERVGNRIVTSSGSWEGAGFVPGGRVFLGASSLYPFSNHDTAWVVAGMSGGTMWVTNASGDAFLEEPSDRNWGAIYAGPNHDGVIGVRFVPSGGRGASHCVIAGNTFSNLWGHALLVVGDHHRITGNWITQLHSYCGIRLSSSSELVIAHNTWLDCTNFLHYSQHELGQIPHPPGSDFYDYEVGFIHATGTGTNVQFFGNWLENSHNPVGQINEGSGAYGFVIRSNVFVGFPGSLSGGRNGLVIEHNTFYRVGFGEYGGHALTIGGNSASTPAYDLRVTGNVFVDIGAHAAISNEGFYGMVNTVNSFADSNFVAGPETMGWGGKDKFQEPNGVNGGNPLFVDPANPRGPDGRPFTADDGLRPLPHSPIAVHGLGALAPVELAAGEPVARFTLESPLGWWDATGTSCNPGWFRLRPWERRNKPRPYDTPELLGIAPVTVRFNAGGSLGGIAGAEGSDGGIIGFDWNFGDGGSEWRREPAVQHTFTTGGQVVVSLTVTNAAGRTARSSTVYRVAGAGYPVELIAPLDLRKRDR